MRRHGKLRSGFSMLGTVDFMMYFSIAELGPLQGGVVEVSNPLQYEDFNRNLLT